MTIKFYLKDAKASEPTLIYARINNGGYNFKYFTKERILPKNWSSVKQEALKGLNGYSSFNANLSRIKSTIYEVWNDSRIKLGNNPPIEEFKNELDKVLNPNKVSKATKMDFFSFFKSIIEESKIGTRLNPLGKPISPNTIKTYVTTYQHLLDYQKTIKRKIDFNAIDLDFYLDYKKYLIENLKLATNSIGKHIQIIKLLMNDATERGLNTNLAFKSKRFVTVREKVDSVYLKENELSILGCYDLSAEPRLEKVRDLFLIGCYTGLRFSDFSIFNPKAIQERMIEIKQQKTSENIVVPIRDEVAKILDKYNGSLPTIISNQKMNLYLKEICEKIDCLQAKETITYTKGGQSIIQNIEKYKLISTHTARRSFCTNEYLAGTPTITIMAISGHKTEKSFMRYIKVTPKEHAKLLQLSWDKRKESKIIPLPA